MAPMMTNGGTETGAFQKWSVVNDTFIKGMRWWGEEERKLLEFSEISEISEMIIDWMDMISTIKGLLKLSCGIPRHSPHRNFLPFIE